MTKVRHVAVTSRSFSRHPVLRKELQDAYQDAAFNDTGRSLTSAELIEFLKDRDGVIIGLDTLDEAAFSALPDLKIVAKYGVGFDSLDIDAMIRRGIKLGWTGGVNRRSVSELVIAFAISLLRHVPILNADIRNGDWPQRPGATLTDRTVGIVGCGHVGKDLAVLLRGFGCRVLANDIVDFPEFYAEYRVEPVDLETLLRTSDIVTLHLPLDETTRNILNRERLASMKEGAILINAARGGLVDEAALKTMLGNKRLAGAGFDVFAVEPPEDPVLLALPNFIATPHIGGGTDEAILAMGRAAIAGLENARVPTADWPPRR